MKVNIDYLNELIEPQRKIVASMSDEETQIRRVITGLLNGVSTGPGHNVFENAVNKLGRDKVKAFQDKYNWFYYLREWDPNKKYSFDLPTGEYKEL